MKRHLAAALAAVLLLPVAACTDDVEAEAKPDATERPTEIQAAWSSDEAQDPYRDTRFTFHPEGTLTTWRVANRIVVLGENGATAFDQEDGHTLWSLTFPAALGQVCAASETTNRNGSAALMFSTAPRARAASEPSTRPPASCSGTAR